MVKGISMRRLATWLIALELAGVSCWFMYLTIRHAVPRHDIFAIVVGVLYAAAMAVGAYILANIARKG
jgi:hypothetical protein